MKRPFTIYDLRFTIWKKSGGTGVPLTAAAAAQRSPRSDLQPSAFSLQPSQGGVALVITVILLAVVTVLALTFLAVSRRERGAVTTSTDTASARLAADDALAVAEAQIVANALATTNPYNFGLLVSTNYLPPTTGNSLSDLTNLLINPRVPVYLSNVITRTMENRFYLDLNRNGVDDTNGWVADVDNNGVSNGVVYETGDPEWIGVLQHPDQPYGPNNLFVARYAFFAVPVGNALDLNAIYNQSLDENQFSMGNNVVIPVNRPPAGDAYLRNQGVGSWELNLAAFLADLNTNQWGQIVGSGATPPAGSATWYQYNRATPTPPGPSANSGHAFEDACALLAYRYANSYGTLRPADALFANGLVFRNDGIDGYSDGPLQTGFPLPFDNDVSSLPWAGADNTNQFFDLQDLFDTSKAATGVAPNQVALGGDFSDRLLAAGRSPSTYNRYTYYRLVSQMGVESAPEQNQINLNYSNALASFDGNGVVTNITFFPGAETNFTLWTPLQFFTIAADQMLRDYSQEWQVSNPSNFVATFNVTNAFSLTNIPVLVSNQFVYTPAVQRVLQLAANIYDATTNNTAVLGTNFPSVFRPTFWVSYDPVSGYTNVSINGYEQVVFITNNSDPQLNLPVEVSSLPLGASVNNYSYGVNVYGVPWIIGAKKGFPNFNEFAMESAFQLTRKLQVTRPNTNDFNFNDYSYNQMFNLSLTNQFGVECWNSYTNDFLRSLAIYVTCTNTFWLTNDEGFSNSFNFLLSGSLFSDSTSNNNNGWPGYNPTVNPLMAPLSFQIPLNTSVPVIPTSMYRFNSGAPFLTTNLALDFEQSGSTYPQPHWGLVTSNDVRVIILDTPNPGSGPYHIIDYVQLSGPNSVRDLTSEITSQYDTPPSPGGNDLWDPTLQNKLPIGLISQIGVSLGNYTAGIASGTWSQTDPTLREDEIDGFRAFFGLGALYNNVGAQQDITTAAMTNAIQAPYTPTATVVQHFSWQANDPLVHYTADDLNWPGANQLNRTLDDLTNENLGQLNQRYMPWGGNPLLAGADQNPYNLALKDSLVWQSDDWDFPTYKLPTVGWLGRVHRGTPWQTVYLKSPDVLQEISINGNTTNYVGTNTWTQWAGDARLALGQNFDAVNTAPIQDRFLFDHFTTTFNDNASRGMLSVNVDAANPSLQAGLAAWSALFSGVIALSNNAVDGAVSPNLIVQHNSSMADFTSFPINPAGPNGVGAALGQIVTGINRTRANSENTAMIVSINGIVTNEIPASFANADGLAGTFEHAGDILSVPQLTDQSPFLNWNDAAQQVNGISDEMYEWLPQQVMSLLRVSGTPQSPVRYVIYSYGQALKPAPNGIYTSGGQYFGMVTNYQVVAEAATRTVLRYNGTRVNNIFQTNDGVGDIIWTNVPSITNNNLQIERFNTLPSN